MVLVRTFYDAISPANIPVTAQGVCGYVDGRYAWSAAEWARFPHAVKARIAVFSSTNDGHVLDVEPGCSTPASAPGWVVRRRKAGIDPTVYCSLSAWPTVKAAFRNAGVTEPHWWVAAYPGNGANLYPGSIAHQWQNPGPVDISVVADYWPGVDTTTTPTQGVDMPLTQADVSAVVTGVLSATLGRSTQNVAQALQNAGSISNGPTLAAIVAAVVPAVVAALPKPPVTPTSGPVVGGLTPAQVTAAVVEGVRVAFKSIP
jgi:hypothetical protein